MKQTRLLRIISFILALIMVLELGPMQVFATEPDLEPIPESEAANIPMPEVPAPTEALEIPEVYIEGEVSELRSEYEKHYRLTDGSYMAVQYQVPVHYEDDGQWVDIDNTLEAVTMFSGDSVYQAVNGENIQAFASDLGDGTIMTMANGDHMISMSIWTYDSVEEAVVEDEPDNSIAAEDDTEETEPAATQESVPEEPDDSAEVTEASNSDNDLIGDFALAEEDSSDMSALSLDETENAQEDATVEAQQDDTIVAQILTEEVAENPVVEAEETEPWELDDVVPDALSSSILYEDVFPGVDLRYDTFSYNVKESIILKQQMDLDEYTYSFLLTLDGLEPELQEDGNIILFDDADEVQYTIPAPYMWDAENGYSDAVFYELEETNDGWILTVCADENWLEAEDRAYPVTIDPSYNIPVANLDYAVAVENATPSSTSDPARPGQLSCGYSQAFGELEGYVRVKTLPAIPAGSTIIEAKLHPISADHWSTAYCRMDIRTLTKNLGDYWDGVVPWSKRPTPSTEPAMDFIYLAKGDGLSLKPNEWDITPAMMQWYEDPDSNYGLRITGVTNAKEKGTSGWCRFSPSESWLTITYRNTVGTESYYTYETQSAVRAGTGYVGDFSSALTVFKTDVSYSSATIPFSVSHVFNSSLRGKELTDFDEDKDTFAPDYAEMKMGFGWQLSVQESVRQTTINTIRYLVYRDGDGTLHYFKNSSGNAYVDEDGLGLKITQSTAGSDVAYMMEDQSGNQRYFRNGYLKYIKDTNGNKICFLYDGDTYSDDHSTWHPDKTAQLTSIVAARNGQTPLEICSFVYNDKNVLYQIVDYAERTTTFDYGEDKEGYLEKITHPDGTTVHYEYDEFGNLTRMYDAEAQYGIEYSYDSDGVSAIHEYTASSIDGTQTEGTHVQRSKKSIQETVYRYDGNDRAFNTADDIVNRYAFDYAGRTINAVTLDSNEDRILGVSTAAYKASSSEEPAANNRISKTGQSGQNGVNLLKGAGVEYTSSYTAESDWSSITNNQTGYTGGFSTTTFRTGKKAMTTTIASTATANDGDNRRAGMYQTVDLAANTTYTFSAYVNTGGVTNFPDGSIYAAFLNSNNGTLAFGNKITYKTGEEIDGGWQRIYCTYTTGTTSVTCRVAVIQENAFGTVYYDDLQLEVGDAPSTVNLLQNATFDFDNHWVLNTAEYADGENLHLNVLSLEGDPEDNIRAMQRVEIGQVCTDQTFLLSGWGKAASAAGCETSFAWSSWDSINSDHGKRYFGLIAKCHYTNGDDEYTYTDYHFMPFNDDYDDWQFASCVIVPDSYYQNVGMRLEYIDVYVVYDNNFNTMYVDNLSLRQEPCTTYTYNAQGNVVSVGATGNESQAVKYKSDNVRPATVWKSESEVYYYQYKESNKYLPEYISNDLSLVYTKYDYDEFGNNDETVIGKFTKKGIDSGYPTLKSSATYSDDGSLLESETNANGQTTSYEYNDARLIEWTKDSKNTVVYNTYNSNNDRAASSFISGQVSVHYSYEDGLLRRIDRGGYYWTDGEQSAKQHQYYNMSYDTFGNMTKVSIGGTDKVAVDSIVLATYDYGEQNGHLNSMTYGNGDSITYHYDELDRLTEEVWDDGTSYKYFYNSEGALTKKVDTATGNAVNYEYDSIGRLIHSSVTTWNAEIQEDETVMLTEHMYDRQNRVKEQSYQIRNNDGTFKTYSLKYTYRGSDGSLVKVESTDGYIDAYELTYDEIARLSTRTNSFFEQTYAYKTTGNTTTTQVESIEYDAGTYASDFEEFTLTYGYDQLGNIETITNSANASDNRTYTYDIQGQLLSETIGSQTNSYTYDSYGNIRTATENGTTHTYSYGNADWKDLLTAYDGRSFLYEGQMYDADWKAAGPVKSGNPIVYYNGTEWNFSWEKGRQLVAASGNGKSISYTYDLAGIRDSKTVDGVTYHYDTLNGQVVRQTWTENGKEHVFDIVYDASGLPYSCVYDGYRYYYVLNQQGDVIRIVGYLGATLCEYQYDAWGNVIDITGTYKNTIGKINPIRYRGYYYDAETGFYYLQSRYYDPSIGRFINADTSDQLGANKDFFSFNLFAYCGNNPVVRNDNGGQFWYVVIGAAVGAAISAITTAVDSVKTTGKVDIVAVGISAVVGGISGGIAATGLSTIAQAGYTAAVSALGSVASDINARMQNKNAGRITAREVGRIALKAVASAAVGFGTSVMGTAAGKVVAGRLEANGLSMVFKGKIGAGCFTKAQAQNLIRQGNKMVNTARGISSVVGTLFTWPTATAFSVGLS